MIYVNSITIGPKNIKIKKGTWYYDIYADVCPTNATIKTLDWHSSNSNVASVNANGDICGVSEGTATIYATAADGSGVADFCNVTVQEQVKVHAVAVTPNEKTVAVGEQFLLSAQAYPETADNRAVRWRSENSNIATVDYHTGCVTAKAIGTTKIYATAVDGSGVEGVCNVTVRAPIKVSSIVIAPYGGTVRVGDKFQLSAEVHPSNADNTKIRWDSADSNIAEVDPYTGYVTAKAVGTTEIRANSVDGSGVKGYCTVTVENTLIYRTRDREKWGFRDSSDYSDIEPIVPEDLTYGEKDANTIISNGSGISLSDLNGYNSISERVTIIKNFFNSKVYYDQTFMNILSDMVDHFVSGSGTDYSNIDLTLAVQSHQRTQSYVNAVIDIIKEYISRNRGNIDNLVYDEDLWIKPIERASHPLVKAMNLAIENGVTELYVPVYPNDNGVIALTLAIDGFYGNKIEIESFESSEEGYSGTLKFTFYDHFGLDTYDMTKPRFQNVTAAIFPGFRQWYILQHWKDLEGSVQPKPFVTNVSFSVPISGTY